LGEGWNRARGKREIREMRREGRGRECGRLDRGREGGKHGGVREGVMKGKCGRWGEGEKGVKEVERER